MGREGCSLTHSVTALGWGVPSTLLHVCCAAERKEDKGGEKEVSVLSFSPECFIFLYLLIYNRIFKGCFCRVYFVCPCHSHLSSFLPVCQTAHNWAWWNAFILSDEPHGLSFLFLFFFHCFIWMEFIACFIWLNLKLSILKNINDGCIRVFKENKSILRLVTDAWLI